MSINSAMLAGVSGLLANSEALSAVSNNIANVNTVGYKTSDATFESLVTNQGVNGAPLSGGVMEQTTQMVTQQGLTTATTSPTDLSINGQGFFVTTSGPAPTSATNPTAYTRAGSFTQDSQGYLQNSAGLYLQGWPVDANGDPVSTTSASALQPINVTALSSAPDATTAVSVDANLQSTQTVSAPAVAAAASTSGAYDPLTNSMSMYDASTGTGVQPDYTIQIPVSDSLGGQRTLQLELLKTDTPNVWDAEVVAPAGDVTGGAGLAANQIAAGTITFSSSGAFVSSTLPSSLTLGASSAAAPTGTNVNWASSLGVSGQTIGLNLADLTQYASASSTTTVTTNGTPFGSLNGIAINSAGQVTATFSNGTSRDIAQVALASFTNPNGLTSINGDAFQASQASGTATLGAPGSNGTGLVDPLTLEASTVNLSSQFTDLITTQQAYSASSKIITTADQMLQSLINLIQ